MTSLEHVASIMRFGYTERQARFLTLAVRYGGYFLRRHYTAFIGRTHGAATVEFLRTAISRAHVVCSVLDGRLQVYHVTAKALYTALGQPDSRHRRRHELRAIRGRVMTLDVVLSDPASTFLATNAEHVEFFVDGLHVPAAMLPMAQQLIGVAPNRALISFVYVDDADRTQAAFERSLRCAAPLCRWLSQPIEIVFATPVDGQQPLAERAFTRVFGDPAGQHAPTSTAEILAYVHARQRCEQDLLGGLTQQDLDAIRESLQRFAGAVGDVWYRRWIAGGDDAVRAALSPLAAREDGPRIRLIVQRLPFDYRPLGLWKGAPC
jgi:hypothetical protein